MSFFFCCKIFISLVYVLYKFIQFFCPKTNYFRALDFKKRNDFYTFLNKKVAGHIETVSSLPLGSLILDNGANLIGGQIRSRNKATTKVQKRVDKFVSENNSKQRDDEAMSSADQPEKPSLQGNGGTGGRKRRSQRLENRRKG